MEDIPKMLIVALMVLIMVGAGTAQAGIGFFDCYDSWDGFITAREGIVNISNKIQTILTRQGWEVYEDTSQLLGGAVYTYIQRQNKYGQTFSAQINVTWFAQDGHINVFRLHVEFWSDAQDFNHFVTLGQLVGILKAISKVVD